MTGPERRIRVRRSPDLAIVVRGDREVLLDLRRLDDPRPLALEGTALAVWREIDGNRDRSAIVAAVAASYQADVAVVGRDVDDFLDELGRLGLVDFD